MRVVGPDDSRDEMSHEPQTPGPGPATLLAGWEQRAVWLYSQTGSMAKVAREMGVPIYEVTKLSRTLFWVSELSAIQREEAAMQNVQMSRILNTTLEEIEERLANGDEVIVNGSIKRKAVDASTLAKIAGVLFDKRQLLRGQPTTIDGADIKIRELADKLRALGAKEVIDIEPSERSEKNSVESIDPSTLGASLGPEA